MSARSAKSQRNLAGILAIAVLFACFVLHGAQANAQPWDESADRWTATAAAPSAYPEVRTDRNVHITMSDGTVLEGSLWLPTTAEGALPDAPLPTLLTMTPYTRHLVEPADRTAAPRPFTINRPLIGAGYAQFMVDVRGTGQSQGVWDPLGHRETADTLEVIDWISHQPWSDGGVGMMGNSYGAITQLLAAEQRPPALKAIFPVVPGSDLIRDVVAPGGGVGVGFLPAWLGAVNALKFIPDADAVRTGTIDPQWLRDRVEHPTVLMDVLLASLNTQTIAEVLNDPSSPLTALLYDDSPLRQAWNPDPASVTVPTFLVGGRHDLFVNSTPRVFDAIPLPAEQKHLVMGDWYHVTPGTGLGAAGTPPTIPALQRAWFDRWLKGIGNGIEGFGPVVKQLQGGAWVADTTAFAADPSYQRRYLSPDGALTAAASPTAATLTVSPGLGTLCSRSAADETAGLVALVPGCVDDSRVAERNALSFTSEAVTAPTRISGPIGVHLETVLDHPDGYWAVTLNDVAPDGKSVELGSGQLVASLRAVDEGRSRRSPDGDLVDPYHQLSLDAREPVTPGVVTGVDLGIPATEALLAPGHRLRINVYAADVPKGLAPRPLLNETGWAAQHLALSAERPSYVVLPFD